MLFLAWIALIVGINVASGPERSNGTPLEHLGYGALMLAGATAIFGFQWFIFKLVRRIAAHTDHRK